VSDIRLCVLCDALIDIEATGVKIIQQPGGHGRRTVVSVDGKTHVLATKRITESRLKAQEER
jgi:hypothetical protein